jgi:hypothetical protein
MGGMIKLGRVSKISEANCREMGLYTSGDRPARAPDFAQIGYSRLVLTTFWARRASVSWSQT